jgi:hypothetical protein
MAEEEFAEGGLYDGWPVRSVRGSGIAAMIAVGLMAVLEGTYSILTFNSGDRDAIGAVPLETSRLIVLVSYLGAALLTIAWLYRARKNLDAFVGARPTWSAGWTIGAWFIPCANIVLVPVVVADVARNSFEDRRGSRARRTVGLIYGCLAVYVGGSFASGLLSAYTAGSVPTFGATVAGVGLTLVANAVAILVIYTITTEQHARIALELDASDDPVPMPWPAADVTPA